jgi:hypothetical protein
MRAREATSSSFYYEAIFLLRRLWSSGRSDRLPLTRTGRRFAAVRSRESRLFPSSHSAVNDRPCCFPQHSHFTGAARPESARAQGRRFTRHNGYLVNQ